MGFGPPSDLAANFVGPSATLATPNPPGSSVSNSTSPGVFSLGSLTFRSDAFQVPQDFVYGTETLGSTHRIPATGSTVPKTIAQTFGVFPKAEMSWEAYYIGSDAAANAIALVGMQANQQVVTLTANARSWQVIVWNVEFTERTDSDLKFRITVKPLIDNNLPSGTPSRDASSQLTLTAQQIAALSIPITAVPQSVTAAKLQAQANASLNAASAQITLIQPEETAGTAAQLATLNTVSQAITAVGSLSTSLGRSVNPNDMQVYQWAQLANNALNSYASTLKTYPGLDGANAAANYSGSLYHLAANVLGDSSRWSDIALVNNIRDPFIASLQTVLIPRV